MKKEVMKKENEALEVYNDADFGEIQAEQEIAKNDIAIPKIIVMQGQSPKVLDGEASFGELRDTLNWELLANVKRGDKPATPLEFVPIHWEKYWINKKADGDKWATEGMVKIASSNADLDQYEVWTGKDGIKRKRVYLHLFYILLEGKTIPYTIGFRGSSKGAGDSIVTQMYVVNKSLKVDKSYKSSPMAKTIKVTPVKVSKNNNTYIVLEASVGRNVSYDEACAALSWYKNVKSGAVKADNTDIYEEGYASDDAIY